ncbi:hypothetical protein [Serratia phage vB_SmaM_Yaphecito]|uniref:Uncharacterized protein n=2 Tax=Moabitevirus TaxID=2843422 RepID=A0A7T3NC00_9CAUD|nr:hypothetical protein [Serratia phage vB_SmaM_Yaphecito]
MEQCIFDSVLVADYKKTIIRTLDRKTVVIPLDQIQKVASFVSITKDEATGFVRFSFFGERKDLFVQVDFGKMDEDTLQYPGLIREGIQTVLDRIIGCYNIDIIVNK